MTSQTILVCLDALLDTRLGAVSQVSQAAAAKLLETDYWGRMVDDFEGMSGGLITNEAYKEAWKNRDVETLQSSALTNMHNMLGTITRSLQSRMARGLEVESVNVVINMYPYRLNIIEQEALVGALRPYVALETTVRTTYLEFEELTPMRLNAEFDAWVMYDFNEWLALHHADLLNNRIPAFTMYVPQLFWTGKVPSQEECRHSSGQMMDPFKLLEMTFMEFLGLDIVTALAYSLIKVAPEQASQPT